MTKEDLLEQFKKDFEKTQGALSEILAHNREIDSTLVDDLIEGDHGKIEEHIEISKLILDGVKGFNDLYKNAPIVLENINKMTDPDSKDKNKPSLSDIMKNLD